MKPLLKIETVPMQIECKLVNARVERKPAARPGRCSRPNPAPPKAGPRPGSTQRPTGSPTGIP